MAAPETTRSPARAAAELPGAVQAAAELPERERRDALRKLLRDGVHDVAMRATVEADGGAEQLAGLAGAVRAHVPEGIEDALNPRVMVFVRLLRHGALEPAWMLAHDNASGVVQASHSVSTWAGGSTLRTRLPLPTLVDPGAQHLVHAWLPGFRDPRWNVPDELYDLTGRVVLRGDLDQALLRDGALHLFGSAYLGLLHAASDDTVTVHFTPTHGGEPVIVPATRGRRPDLVQTSGPELSRLAWGGWSAHVDLGLFGTRPGSWRAELTLEQQGVPRRGPLGARRGPLAAPDLVGDSVEAHGRVFRLENADARQGLTLVVASVRPTAALVGAAVGRSTRRLANRLGSRSGTRRG